jgi:anaerobic magnesium-protoporphyrin IX monomethyl ester cyclase
MKVLLLPSPCSENSNPLFPLGLVYIASKIKGHEVYLFDPNCAGNPQEEAMRMVRKTVPDVIGISLRNVDIFYTDSKRKFSGIKSAIPGLIDFVREAKRASPTPKIVIGGAGFTIFARKLMSLVKEIDVGIHGEGEISFPEYMNNIKNPGKVRGLYLRREGKVVYTGNPGTVDMDSLEFPKDLGFLDVRKYKNTHIGVQTKRGCRFRCAYCTYPFIEGNCIRMRSPRKVVDEIERVHDVFGVKDLFFTDSVFNVPKEHASRICNEIVNRKLEIGFNAFLRPDYIDSDFMKGMIESGFNSLSYSFDALSQKTLDKLNKELNIRTIMDSCRLAKKFDMGVEAFIFSDISFETPLTAIETLKNILKIGAIMRNPRKLYFRFSGIRIYPQTLMHLEGVKEGNIKGGENLLRPLFYKTSLYGRSASKLTMFYERLYQH